MNCLDQHQVDRRQSGCKAIANKICIRTERKLGVWGLAFKKNFDAMPSRMSENALLQSTILSAFPFDLYAEKGERCFHQVLMTITNIGESYAKVMPSCQCNNGPAYMLSHGCVPKPKIAISSQYTHLYTIFYSFLKATTYESSITFSKFEIIGWGNHPLTPPPPP